MLAFNGQEIKLEHFFDGTVRLDGSFVKNSAVNPENPVDMVEWYYENDAELFALICVANHLRDHGKTKLSLHLPYIPHARQDRVESYKDVFTLDYFAAVINSLNFEHVISLDPHSNVSKALIKRLISMDPTHYVWKVFHEISEENGRPVLFYPDEGASKRYSKMFKLPYLFGMKTRDWQSGKIISSSVVGDVEMIKGQDVLIVDDICCRGGTFKFAAENLKALGAEDIYLYISHCENTILEGDLITSGLIKRIYTTDSIFTKTHPLITVMSLEEGY